INFTFKAKDTTLKNNTKTLSIEVKLTKELAFKLSSLVGNWKDGNNKFKVSDKGLISDISINNVPATDTIQIANWDTDKDKEVPKHTENINNQSSGSYKYDFQEKIKASLNCGAFFICFIFNNIFQ
ncbi:MAG: hypothetical protein KHX06_01815, partial [Brachyspira sp.]|nr:hypothetical protein [Brachyspira sp.]